MLGLQVPHDVHVLLEATARDDLLPFRDRAPILLLDGREVRGRSRLRPRRRLLDHVDVFLSLAPTMVRRSPRPYLCIGRRLAPVTEGDPTARGRHTTTWS